MALVAGALGTLSRHTRVWTMNVLDENGTPLALALIRGARFIEADGETTLSLFSARDGEQK